MQTHGVSCQRYRYNRSSATDTLLKLGITISFQLFLAFVVFIGAIVAPESPVLLLKKGKPEEARQSLAVLRNIGMNSEEMSQEYEEISIWLTEQSTHSSVKLIECFQGSNLRRQLLGVCMAILTISTGITFWFGYGTTFFQQAGVSNSYLISLILALVNAIFTVLSTFLVEQVGRRLCLLWGGMIMGVAMLVPAVINMVSPDSTSSHNALIAGTIIFIAAYAATWGSIGMKTIFQFSRNDSFKRSLLTISRLGYYD